MKEKTLYVSDLDGTLLRSNETTSEYTNEVINRMTEQGMLFSYATARSICTVRKVTKGLNAGIPLILYNGAFIVDNYTGEVLSANYFEETVKDLLRDLSDREVYPIVYAMIDGAEKFSYIENKCSPGMMKFIITRNDSRKHPVQEKEELAEGKIFYVTCIDLPEKLLPLYEKYKDRYYCVYQRDIYSGEQWLEIMPSESTKANAVRKLKTLLGCSRVVAFGDGMNDMELFQAADECYAVANAVPELKAAATGVIGGNNEDGVATWLEQNVIMPAQMRLLFEIDKKDYDKRETVFVRPSARGIIIKDSKVAMIHSLKYNYYKFPGGGIEAGEDRVKALIREVREEAGREVIPETVREYGMVHRIQKVQREDVFIQDNYYYLCDVEDEPEDQKLDDYEKEEQFTLEYVDPCQAIRVNRENSSEEADQVMIEREARVLEILIQERHF